MENGSYTLLGQLLLQCGLISASDLEEGLRQQQLSRAPLGQALIAMGVLSQRDLEVALRAQARLRGRGDQARVHLLVVDDDPEVGAVVGDILAGAGYSVGVAQTGDEALAAVVASDSARPALIVLDLNMPGRSGLELLSLLQQLGGHPVPVVVLTGRGDLEEEVRAQSTQVHAFLTKPTPARDLVKVVDAVLNEAPALR
jgi:CheY-like chemotaxis protein